MCRCHTALPSAQFRFTVTACLRESSSIVANRARSSTSEMDAAPRTLEVEHHKLTAKLEAAERAAERAALEKSRLQNDAAIQRTQLEEAVAALHR
jgi:hypothetical protein